jgi:hypothetical protein
MTLDKERFELYRKWFQTLLVKEFLNLSLKQQDHFLIMVDKFIKDCQRVHEEAVKILEKKIEILITDISSPNGKSDHYIVTGQSPQSPEYIKIEYPISIKKPSIGDVLTHIVYSTDGEIWYSSKEELITGSRK